MCKERPESPFLFINIPNTEGGPGGGYTVEKLHRVFLSPVARALHRGDRASSQEEVMISVSRK